MADTLLSVGIDVGTSTTQLIVSRLTVENKASAFSVPEMEISDRQVVYQSPIHFTPLLGENLVDGEKIRDLIAREYEKAGIRPAHVDTGAVIITGETSRKENAAQVLNSPQIVQRANLKETSLYHLSQMCTIQDGEEFTRRFIARDREARSHD